MKRQFLADSSYSYISSRNVLYNLWHTITSSRRGLSLKGYMLPVGHITFVYILLLLHRAEVHSDDELALRGNPLQDVRLQTSQHVRAEEVV